MSFRDIILVVMGFAVASGASPRERAEELVAEMTFAEKVSMLHGKNGVYTGNVPAIERLGIPALNMQDGPQGFRTAASTGGDGTSTSWPSALTIAASWDGGLLYRWGSSMASEFRAKGANMALAPGIGIARVPTAGRNFEYLCGEDPILGAELVKPLIRGIQDQGIIANAKHWVNNEIEDHRMLVSAIVSERVRFELYYPPFQAAVDVGVLSAMCSYNRINDVYACQNNETLGHLKNDLGFDGWVVSDWTATHSTGPAKAAGLDMEMPLGIYFNEAFLALALKTGGTTMEDIDDSVARILTSMISIGLLDREPEGDPMANVTSDAHNELAREIAAKSTVLLKNTENILPMDLASFSEGDCIAVIGDTDTVSGGGSGHVVGPYVISPVQGVHNALLDAGLADVVTVKYAQGTGKGENSLEAAVALAGECAATVVVVATTSSEGNDRESLSLGEEQDALVYAIAKTVYARNQATTTAAGAAAVADSKVRLAVAVNCPGAVLMPWVEEVPAVLISWMPGQEAGNALSDVLFGKVNPSARLPVTMPNKENEVGFSKEQYPGVGVPPEAYYLEELLIGYRWYDANQVDPLFPFGHGLSYTTFGYRLMFITSSLDSPDVTVTVEVSNTGTRAGTEVVQLYLAFPDDEEEKLGEREKNEVGVMKEPPKQLKAFEKVQQLAPGGTATVTFELHPRDFSIWDAEGHAWAVVSGSYQVQIGASSRDIRITAPIVIQ